MKAISPTQIPDSGQSFGNHKNNCLMCDTNQQHFDVALAARQPLKSLDQPICVLITYIFFNNSTVRRKDQQKICIPSMFIAIILACFSVAVLDTTDRSQNASVTFNHATMLAAPRCVRC